MLATQLHLAHTGANATNRAGDMSLGEGVVALPVVVALLRVALVLLAEVKVTVTVAGVAVVVALAMALVAEVKVTVASVGVLVVAALRRVTLVLRAEVKVTVAVVGVAIVVALARATLALVAEVRSAAASLAPSICSNADGSHRPCCPSVRRSIWRAWS